MNWSSRIFQKNQNYKCGKKTKCVPGPVSLAIVPVTTKIPAPMEAPIPSKIRSNTPNRRSSFSPDEEEEGIIGTDRSEDSSSDSGESDAATMCLDRRAERVKFCHHEECCGLCIGAMD